jgi:hypothetical protein
MKIAQLLKSINEAGPRTAAQQASMQAAASGATPNSASPTVGGVPNLSTGLPQATTNPQPTTLGTLAASPNATTPTATTATTATTTPAATTATTATPNANTSRPSLSQRIAQGIGGVVRSAGAVAGIPSGIGRAFSQGKEAGATAIGGAAPAAPGANGAVDNDDEVAQLKSQMQIMQQKLTRAGI